MCQVVVSSAALVFAGLLDMVDGYLARKLDACSTFGGALSILNPLIAVMRWPTRAPKLEAGGKPSC